MSIFKPSKVMVIREAITKVVQILTQKGLTVIQQGTEARVEYNARTLIPERVYLPMIPDNATDEFLAAVQGFLDHEVGHVLFTDPAELARARKLGLSQLHAPIEDVMIERQMGGTLVGTRGNLRAAAEFYLKEFVTPKLFAAVRSGDVADEFSVLYPSIIRALGGQLIFQDFLKDNGSLFAQNVMALLEPLRARMESVSTSEEAVNISEEVRKLLQMEREQPDDTQSQGEAGNSTEPQKGGDQQKESENDGGDSSDGSSGPGEAGDSGGEGSGDPQSGEAGDQGADAQGEGEGQAAEGVSDAGQDEEQAGAQNGEGGEGGSSSPQEVTDEVHEAKGGKGFNDAKAGGSQSTSSVPDTTFMGGLSWAEIEAAIKSMQDFDSSVSSVMSKVAAKELARAKYVPFTTDKDVIEPLRVSEGARAGAIASCEKSIEEPVMAMVNPMAKNLERAIAARSAAIMVGGKRKGRLHGASLHRGAIGDDRIFRTKEESNTKDVAVSLVVDASGSMKGKKILTAAQAAFALSAVLERLRIKHEVISFTTGGALMSSGQMSAATAAGISYSRTCQIVMPIIKEFHEPLNSNVRARFGAMPQSIHMMSNIDGESLEYAARRLMAQKASRHVMIVLSDGRPAGATMNGASSLSTDLRDRVKRLSQAGIDIVGIGIQSSDVRSFYPKNVTISNVEELPGVVMGRLREMLVPT